MKTESLFETRQMKKSQELVLALPEDMLKLILVAMLTNNTTEFERNDEWETKSLRSCKSIFRGMEFNCLLTV